MDKSQSSISQETDDQLIDRVCEQNDQVAFQTLVERHNPNIMGRFMKATGHRQDAEDLCQQLWTRVATNLNRYERQGKFDHYIARIATNLLHSHRNRWVQAQAKVSGGAIDPDTTADQKNTDPDDRADVESLINELIPQLVVEQRTAFLLRHESEFWQDEQRLSWQDLGTLNGVDLDTVWQRFDTFRRSVLNGNASKLKDSEEACVFTVWSQAQRPSKDYRYSDKDFAEILDISPETFRTRYRTALKTLVNMRKQRDC